MTPESLSGTVAPSGFEPAGRWNISSFALSDDDDNDCFPSVTKMTDKTIYNEIIATEATEAAATLQQIALWHCERDPCP